MIASNDKDLKLVSSPEEHDDRPVPPKYEPLWPVKRIREAMRPTPHPIDGYPVWPSGTELAIQVARDYDDALAKAQFEAWQWRGLLKESLKGKTNE